MIRKIGQWIQKKVGKGQAYPPIPQYSNCVIEGRTKPFVLGRCRQMTGEFLEVDCDYLIAVELNQLKGKSTLFLCGFVNAVAFNAIIDDWRYFEPPDEISFVRIYITMQGGPVSIDA